MVSLNLHFVKYSTAPRSEKCRPRTRTDVPPAVIPNDGCIEVTTTGAWDSNDSDPTP